MKKVEVINTPVSSFPKERKNLVYDETTIYSERQVIENSVLDKYTDENSKLERINQDYRLAVENLDNIEKKYYFLKIFSKAADKANDFNNKMLSMDKYVNQVKKMFLDLKIYKNNFAKKNVVSENEMRELFDEITDFLQSEEEITYDLQKLEAENYPKIKMTSFNLCKNKTCQELENIANEVNKYIATYKNLNDAYDYICYNSGELISEFTKDIISTIHQNPTKCKIKVSDNFFFDNDIIMFLDMRGWIELFSKIDFLKNKCDASVFEKPSIVEKYHELEINYFIVLIYSETVLKKGEKG